MDEPLPTILLAEDDPDLGPVLEFLLAREGYKPVLAADGRRVRELLLAMEPPRLVLLDILLPFVSGIDLIPEIRATRGWETIPIVMLTAKSEEEDIVLALERGANDYVAKPFQPKELLARLKRFLRQKGGAKS